MQNYFLQRKAHFQSQQLTCVLGQTPMIWGTPHTPSMWQHPCVGMSPTLYR